MRTGRLLCVLRSIVSLYRFSIPWDSFVRPRSRHTQYLTHQWPGPIAFVHTTWPSINYAATPAVEATEAPAAAIPAAAIYAAIDISSDETNDNASKSLAVPFYAKAEAVKSPINNSDLNVSAAATFNQKVSPVWAYCPHLSLDINFFLRSGEGIEVSSVHPHRYWRFYQTFTLGMVRLYQSEACDQTQTHHTNVAFSGVEPTFALIFQSEQ